MTLMSHPFLHNKTMKMEEATTFLPSPSSQQNNNRRNEKGEGRGLTFKLPLLSLG
jgi:hypothetical protein